MSRRAPAGRTWRLAVAAALASTGCGGFDSSDLPGVVRVTTSTTGASPDPDGYVVAVDGGARHPIGTVDQLVLPPLEPGTHQLDLRGVAGNCTLASDSSQSVAVGRADTSDVRFEVDCGPALGGVEFVTHTVGDERDPNGYLIQLDTTHEYAVPPNGVYGAFLPVGVYTPSVSGATPNCVPSETAARRLEVVREGLTRFEVSYACSSAAPAGRGHEIAFVSERSADAQQGLFGQIFLMNDDGTGLRSFPPVAALRPYGLTWSRDGSSLVYAAYNPNFNDRFDAVYRLDLESGVSTRIPLAAVSGRGLALSPDGSALAYTDNEDPNSAENEVVVASIDGANRQMISSPDEAHDSPTWSPDGTRVAFVRRGLNVAIVVATLGTAGEQPVAADFPQDLEPLQLAWSPRGDQIAFQGFSDRSIDLYVVDVGGKGVRRLTAGPGRASMPAWSSDGSRLVFSSARDGNSEIYLMNGDGSAPVRLTNDLASDDSPAWRP